MRIFSILTFAILGSSGAAHAQASEAAPPLKERETVTFREIERGFFLGVGAGWSVLANPPAQVGTPRPFSPGQVAQVQMGYDLGERISLGAFLLASAHRAGAEYIGKSEGTASGHFSTLVPGVAAKLGLLGFNDGQEIRRTWIYLRGGGGYALFSPQKLIPDSEILLFAGPGVEYFTRMRHFSVGLEVTGNYLLTSGTYGLSVTPTLRYAF